MNSQISTRDWENLSAYLDRQLKPKEIASLEARLSADPVLSAALGELQLTRDSLRSLPRMRAPRNFTLTPQMVGQRSALRVRPAARLAPAFGFASALATFLLILVIAGDFLGILTRSSQPVALAPARTSEVAAQPATNIVAQEQAAKQAAPASSESLQATSAATEGAVMLEAPQARQVITPTAALSSTAEAADASGTIQPFTQTEITPVLQAMMPETDTLTVAMTETIFAKQASGMGAGILNEPDENMSMSSAILTPEGLMWNSTISLTVSPTETLSFPMTVTMEGPGIGMAYDTVVGLGGSQPEEPLSQTEPTLATAPEETPAPAELPGPTEAAVSVQPTEAGARVVETPAAPQPELQTLKQTVAPTQTLASELPVAQPARTGQLAVRLIEIGLALLAIVTGSVALYAWWAKRF